MSLNLTKGINNMYVKAMKTSYHHHHHHHHQLFGSVTHSTRSYTMSYIYPLAVMRLPFTQHFFAYDKDPTQIIHYMDHPLVKHIQTDLISSYLFFSNKNQNDKREKQTRETKLSISTRLLT